MDSARQGMRLILFYWLLIFLLSSCGKGKVEAPEKPDVGTLVKTVVVGEESAQREVSFPGRVIANKQVDLAFQVSGQIIEFPVKKGQPVEKNKLLAKLDSRDYQHRYNAESANLEKSKQHYDRAEELLESGTISKAMYDDRKAAYDIAIARTAQSKKALDDTNLLAPLFWHCSRYLCRKF